MNKRKSILFISLLIMILLAFLLLYRVSSNEAEVFETEEIISVKTTNITLTSSTSHLNYSALIQPENTEEVMFSTIATVEELHVKEGDVVQPGQKIVTLDDEQIDNQTESSYQTMLASEANKDAAKANLDTQQRELDALKIELSTDANYLSAQNNVNESQKALEEAQNEFNLAQEAITPYEDDLETSQNNYDTLSEEYNTLQEEIAQLDNEIMQAQAQLKELEDLENENPDDEHYSDEIEQKEKEIDDLEITKQQKESALLNKKTEVDAAEKQVTLVQESVNTAKADNQYDQKQSNLLLANTTHDANKAALDNIEARNEAQLAVVEGQVETARFNYESQEAAYEAAKSNYENNLETSQNLTYTAKSSGVVIMIATDEGEVATPLAPIVVIASEGRIAQFGASSSEVAQIHLGNPVEVIIKEESYSAVVSNIAQIPDETSRTYLIDVTIDNAPNNVLLGELVSAKVFTGESDGVWIPIGAILNDTKDYVFVVEDGRAIRRDIIILDLNNDLVKVSGLNANDQLIVEGMTKVKSGILVHVVTDND